MTDPMTEPMTSEECAVLVKAIRMAVLAHGDQMNKDGTPYILHPLRLMMQAQTCAAKVLAVLHDVVEDTPVTATDILDAGFPEDVRTALAAVTKREGEDYEAFIERISADPLAVDVKLLDLYDNIDVTRLPVLGDWELARTAKYHRAILKLSAKQKEFRSNSSNKC